MAREVLGQWNWLWEHGAALILLAAGVALVWRGLLGDEEGGPGLLRPNVAMLFRIERFRLLLFGLVLVGVGSSLVWQARWLFWLAIGFGFVEILESSALIAVWRRNPVRGRTWVTGDKGTGDSVETHLDHFVTRSREFSIE